MNINEDKIDESALALLYLTLHEKGYIENTVGKSKTVLLADKGLKESQRLFERLFTE